MKGVAIVKVRDSIPLLTGGIESTVPAYLRKTP